MKSLLYIFNLVVLMVVCSQAVGETEMWFKHAAPWWDHGTPIGNGRLGAMVMGGVSDERIVLNEESVWSRGGEYTDKPGGHAHIDEVRQLLFAGQYSDAEGVIAVFMGEDDPLDTTERAACLCNTIGNCPHAQTGIHQHRG